MVTNIMVLLVVSIALVMAAFLFFARVRSDYRIHGKLSPLSAFLQTAILCLYAVASYIYLDSSLGRINTASPLFAVSILLIVTGLVTVLAAMGKLGWGETFGKEAAVLRRTGLYRYSRNPQLVGGLFLIVGYALLWPSWSGAVWVGIYVVIAHFMIRTEEEHLERLFGEEYREYCESTPCYIGLSRR